MITKIISGGQTGADQAGLAAAKALGLETGGTAPPKFYTEEGIKTKLLRDTYKLVEGIPDRTIYRKRTRQNIIDSDGTVIFGDTFERGTQLTINTCEQLEKPYVVNPKMDLFVRWIVNHKIQVLNVAGNRESKNPGIYAKVYKYLVDSLKE